MKLLLKMIKEDLINFIKKIGKCINALYNFLGKNQIATIATIILACSTFYSAHVALEIANNDEQKYLINNGFIYSYDKNKDSYYKHYIISLTNASTDKPINLTGGFSISISTDKNFKKKNSSTSLPAKTNISELLNTSLFPTNLKYSDEITFNIDEKFAKYIKTQYPNRIRKCIKSKDKCKNIPFYINFCLYDTLDNKYCYLFNENEIDEISNFIEGKKYVQYFYVKKN